MSFGLSYRWLWSTFLIALASRTWTASLALTVPKCTFKRRRLPLIPPLYPDHWVYSYVTNRSLDNIRIYYDTHDKRRQVLADLVATLIWNSLGIPVSKVDTDFLLDYCGRNLTCHHQQYDIDPASTRFGDYAERLVAEKTWITIAQLSKSRVPECFKSILSPIVIRDSPEACCNDPNYCPEATFDRGPTRMTFIYGIYATPTALDILGHSHDYPIFWKTLFNASWTSSMPSPNRAEVEANNENETTYLLARLSRWKAGKGYWFVPDHCWGDLLLQCRVIFKYVNSRDEGGILEGLLVSLKLPFVVQYLVWDDYNDLLTKWGDDPGQLGSMIIHGYAPSIGSKPLVMIPKQRIQFPNCLTQKRYDAARDTLGRTCEWPLTIPRTVINARIWQKFPPVIPVVDYLPTDQDTIVNLIRSMEDDPETALCSVAQNIIQHDLKYFLRTCYDATQAVAYESGQCIHKCPEGSRPFFRLPDYAPDCECSPGWHTTQTSPNLRQVCETASSIWKHPERATEGELQILAQCDLWARQELCGAKIISFNKTGDTGIERDLLLMGNRNSCDFSPLSYPGACTPCPPGYICKGGTDPPQACIEENTMSMVARSSQKECRCRAGYYKENGVCSPCQAGRYKMGPGNNGCKGTCAPTTGTEPGASFPFECSCDRGLYLRGIFPAYECRQCPEGAKCHGYAYNRSEFMVAFASNDWVRMRRAQGIPYAKEGYHEKDNTTHPPSDPYDVYLPQFQKCPTKADCREGGKCGDGNTAYLCSECTAGYARGTTHPDRCKKCGNSSYELFLWILTQVVAAHVLFFLAYIANLAHSSPAVLSIPVIKMVLDEIDLLHSIGDALTVDEIIDFQRWPDPSLRKGWKEGCVWIFAKFLWPLVESIGYASTEWLPGATTSVFGCLLDASPGALEINEPTWTPYAKIEYRRMVFMLLSVPFGYFVALILLFPVYAGLVRAKRKSLSALQSKWRYFSRLREFVNQSPEDLSSLHRDLDVFEIRLKNKGLVLFFQSVVLDDWCEYTKSDKFRFLKNYLVGSTPMFMVMQFLMFSALFRFFSAAVVCQEWPSKDGSEPDGHKTVSGDHRRLGVAGSIECGTDDHWKFAIPAYGGILLYGIGPAVIIYLVLRNSHNFSMEERRVWAFHLNGYKLSYHWWDAVRYIRRMLMWSVNFAPDSMRVFATLALAVFFTVIQASYKPYKKARREILNRLELAMLLASTTRIAIPMCSTISLSPTFGTVVLLVAILANVFVLIRFIGCIMHDVDNFIDWVKRQKIFDTISDLAIPRTKKVEVIPESGDPITTFHVAEDDKSEDVSISVSSDGDSHSDGSSSSSESQISVPSWAEEGILRFQAWWKGWTARNRDIVLFAGKLGWALGRIVKLLGATIRLIANEDLSEADYCNLDVGKGIVNIEVDEPQEDCSLVGSRLARAHHHRHRRMHRKLVSKIVYGRADREFAYRRKVASIMDIFRSEMYTLLDGYRLQSVPVAWLKGILEEVCLRKTQKPNLAPLTGLLESMEQDNTVFGEMIGAMELKKRVEGIAEQARRSGSRSQKMVHFTIVELQTLLTEMHDSGADFLHGFFASCFEAIQAQKIDKEISSDKMEMAKYALKLPHATTASTEVQSGQEAWRVQDAGTEPDETNAGIAKLLNGPSSESDWDLLAGAEEHERAAMKETIQRQRYFFHRRCAQWVRELPTILFEFGHIEADLRATLDQEITPMDQSGTEIEACYWAKAEGVGVAQYLSWARDLLLYDLDFKASFDLVRKAKYRVEQMGYGSWERSHVHWLCSAGVSPHRWLNSNISFTKLGVSYSTQSEIKVVESYICSRVEQMDTHGAADSRQARLDLLEYDKGPSSGGLDLRSELLEGFLKMQYQGRRKGDRSNVSANLLVSDDMNIEAAMAKLKPQEAKKVVNALAGWTNAWTQSEIDFIFGRALAMYREAGTSSIVLTKKGNQYYAICSDEQVSPEQIAAAAIYDADHSSHGEDAIKENIAKGLKLRGLQRDDREVVWGAMAGDLVHAYRVIHKKKFEKTFLAKQAIEKYQKECDGHEADCERIKQALQSWTTWVDLWFARIVFEKDIRDVKQEESESDSDQGNVASALLAVASTTFKKSFSVGLDSLQPDVIRNTSVRSQDSKVSSSRKVSVREASVFVHSDGSVGGSRTGVLEDDAPSSRKMTILDLAKDSMRKLIEAYGATFVINSKTTNLLLQHLDYKPAEVVDVLMDLESKAYWERFVRDRETHEIRVTDKSAWVLAELDRQQEKTGVLRTAQHGTPYFQDGQKESDALDQFKRWSAGSALHITSTRTQTEKDLEDSCQTASASVQAALGGKDEDLPKQDAIVSHHYKLPGVRHKDVQKALDSAMQGNEKLRRLITEVIAYTSGGCLPAAAAEHLKDAGTDPIKVRDVMLEWVQEQLVFGAADDAELRGPSAHSTPRTNAEPRPAGVNLMPGLFFDE